MLEVEVRSLIPPYGSGGRREDGVQSLSIGSAWRLPSGAYDFPPAGFDHFSKVMGPHAAQLLPEDGCREFIIGTVGIGQSDERSQLVCVVQNSPDGVLRISLIQVAE